MKFLADMGISLRTVEWLRELGHDVFHLRDRGLQKLPDDKILALAQVEQRIILTIDLDFAQLLAVSKQSLPSVILFRLGNENYDEINQRLIEVLKNCQQELKTGAIVSVNNETFRVKKLPI
jgi:predicted nuclease of predicted toxin-antitoxin system